MKTFLTVFLSILLSTGAVAQTFLTQAKPYGEKLWGYINQEGEFVIKPVYKTCYAFSEDGLAPIYESKQYTFINAKGEIIEPEEKKIQLIKGVFGFGGVEGYHDGLVAVLKGKKWGYFNTEGKVAIPLKYDKATVFSGGFAITKLKKDFFVINTKGDETKVEIEGVIDIKPFSEGMAAFKTDKKVTGFIDNTGKVVVEPKFTAVGPFKNGLAWAKTSDKKVGFINKKGEWAIEPTFLAAKNFESISGLARVKTEDKWTYVNSSGEMVDLSRVGSISDFYEGLAKGKKDRKIGFYNNTGEWIVKPTLEGARNFKNGFVAAKQSGKWGFVDKTGEWVIKPAFAAVKDMEKVK